MLSAVTSSQTKHLPVPSAAAQLLSPQNRLRLNLKSVQSQSRRQRPNKLPELPPIEKTLHPPDSLQRQLPRQPGSIVTGRILLLVGLLLVVGLQLLSTEGLPLVRSNRLASVGSAPPFFFDTASCSRLHGHQECLVRVALRLAGRGSSVYDPTGASGLSMPVG